MRQRNELRRSFRTKSRPSNLGPASSVTISCGSNDLQAAKARVTARNSNGETALTIATRLGQGEMAHLLKASLPWLTRLRFWLGLEAA